MPRVFNVDKWIVYFWSNESLPLEPIHVHISEGKPDENGTKIWITQSGKTASLQPNASAYAAPFSKGAGKSI